MYSMISWLSLLALVRSNSQDAPVNRRSLQQRRGRIDNVWTTPNTTTEETVTTPRTTTTRTPKAKTPTTTIAESLDGDDTPSTDRSADQEADEASNERDPTPSNERDPSITHNTNDTSNGTQATNPFRTADPADNITPTEEPKMNVPVIIVTVIGLLFLGIIGIGGISVYFKKKHDANMKLAQATLLNMNASDGTKTTQLDNQGCLTTLPGTAFPHTMHSPRSDAPRLPLRSGAGSPRRNDGNRVPLARSGVGGSPRRNDGNRTPLARSGTGSPRREGDASPGRRMSAKTDDERRKGYYATRRDPESPRARRKKRISFPSDSEGPNSSRMKKRLSLPSDGAKRKLPLE